MDPSSRLPDAIGAIAECSLALIVTIGITLVLTLPLAVVDTRYEIAATPGSAAAERELLGLLEERGVGSGAEIVAAGEARELHVAGRPVTDLLRDRVPELAERAGLEPVRTLLPEMSPMDMLRRSGWIVMTLQAAVFALVGGGLLRFRVVRDPGEPRARVAESLLVGFVAGLGAFGLGLVIGWIMHALDLPVEEQEWAQEMLRDRALLTRLAPWIVLLVPWSEEVFFRGYALRLLQRRAGLSPAVIVSTTLFALVHFNLSGFPAYLAIGAMFSWAALRSGRLLAPVVAHALYNGLVLVVGVVQVQV
jgi:membrane protease YdiL (CAAX protease family)